MPHSTACSVLVCLPPCGHGRGNGARPREMADSRVLATARHIHICLRVAVLRDSSHFRGFRPAAAPTVTAQGILGNWANNACVRLSRALAAPSGFALRAQPTRRLRRGRIFGEKLDSSRALHPSSTSSAEYRLLVSRASAGASRELSSRRSPAHPSSDRFAAHFVRGIPLLTHAPLARPSAMARFFS